MTDRLRSLKELGFTAAGSTAEDAVEFVAPPRCWVQMRHEPAALTVELHHVIPVAWQLLWVPAVEPYPGTDPDRRGHLWDARTVAACPTHHRSVHALIVALMRRVAALGVDAVPATPFAGLPAKTLHPHAPELTVAKLGLQRVLDVGGSLLALTRAGEWGQV